MPKCPECGEPVQKGQTHCFACGSDFVPSPVKIQFLKGNVVFIGVLIAGCLIAAIVAILIAQPKPKRIPAETHSQFTTKEIAKRPAVSTTKPKILTPPDEIAELNQIINNLEEKITRLEKLSQTEEFTKDEKDALRFARNLLSEMKPLIGSIQDAKKKEIERKRFLRQFRIKQNEIEQFLIILKKHL